MQRLKIDVLKFTGAKPFTSKDGKDFIAIPVAENNIYVGAKCSYLELTLMDNRDGEDQYGNNGFVTVGLDKSRREAGEKSPIVGNWKYIGNSQSIDVRSPEYGKRETSQNGAIPPSRSATDDALDEDEQDSIPF